MKAGVFLIAMFLAWDCGLAGFPAPAGDAATHEGADGWRFLSSELRHLNQPRSPEKSDAAAAVVDFAKQLQEMGIRLLVVPVPPKAAVHAERLGCAVPNANPDAGMLRYLQEQGVEVIDLWPLFHDSSEALFCQRDSHWNGKGVERVAERLASALDAEPGEVIFESKPVTLTIEGDLGGTPENVEVREVTGPESVSREAPVLLFGDSHTLVFHEGGDMHSRGAGLPEHLALRLGKPVDLLGVRGSGATAARVGLARRARTDPEWLKNKSAVIWVFAARDFTQADSWKPIRLLPL